MEKIVKYLYGEEVKYEYDLLKLEDFELLQAFSCGNEKLDYYIHCELIHNEQIDTEDGLPFKLFLFEGREGHYHREKHWHRSIAILAE